MVMQANGWTIYNLATTTPSSLIAPGQGFFVAAESTGLLSYSSSSQSTGSSDDFIVGRNAELVYLKLNLNSGFAASRTDFYFNDNASQGLDVGYDAQTFDDTPTEIGLYSHLLQDNEGKAMAIQALNPSDLSDVSIPLGVHANQGDQITFSINESTLPASVNVYLDDVLANTSNLLNTGDYVITPTTNLSGTGRFFLRTTEGALSTIENDFDSLNIFALNSSKEIIVTGQLQSDTNFELYDIQGRNVVSIELDNSILENRIDVSNVSSGVYVVSIQNNTQHKTQKVVIK